MCVVGLQVLVVVSVKITVLCGVMTQVAMLFIHAWSIKSAFTWVNYQNIVIHRNIWIWCYMSPYSHIFMAFLPQKDLCQNNALIPKIEYSVIFLPCRGFSVVKLGKVSSSAEVKNSETIPPLPEQLYLVLSAALTQSGKLRSAGWLSWQVFRGFFQSLATNAGIVPYIRPQPILCTFLPSRLFTDHHLTL
jgi:hypothetical protein